MKCLYAFFLSTVFSSVWANSQDWRVVALSTTSCQDKIQVLAKEGEKFVYVTSGQEKIKLPSTDGAVFSADSGRSVVFKNAPYTFTQPSMVDPNPPKLEIESSGQKSICKMKAR
jgi:hypothetical protein